MLVRTVGLTEYESYVRLLNLPAMYDVNIGKLKTPLIYFSVREEEFWDAALYTMGLTEASQSLVNVMIYVRRRMGGMSLVTKELMAPWDLSKRDVHAFCLAVTAYV